MTRLTLIVALLLILGLFASAAQGQVCRVPDKKRSTTAKECKAMAKKALETCETANRIVSIGYGAICPRPCTGRAYLKCSQQIKKAEGLESFDCYSSKRADVAKLVKRLIRLECNKLAPYFRDGGCKNTDGNGNHGCSTLRCPLRCIKLSECAWKPNGGRVLTREEVRSNYNNPSVFYEGSCGQFNIT